MTYGDRPEPFPQVSKDHIFFFFRDCITTSLLTEPWWLLLHHLCLRDLSLVDERSQFISHWIFEDTNKTNFYHRSS